MATADHGWLGRGKARVARAEGRLCFEIDGLATRTGPARDAIRELCRKEYRGLGPTFAPFAVSIWIEAPWNEHERRRRIDVDNVAKACLDALTGVVWRDDSQIQRLQIEKVDDPRERITIEIAEHAAGGAKTLQALRERVASRPASVHTNPDKIL